MLTPPYANQYCTYEKSYLQSGHVGELHFTAAEYDDKIDCFKLFLNEFKLVIFFKCRELAFQTFGRKSVGKELNDLDFVMST